MAPIRKPSIAKLIVRVVVVSLLATALTFAVSLFLGIAGIVLTNMLRGGGINMASAYRHVAFPIAIVALVVAFIIVLRNEIREYRRELATHRKYLTAA